MGLNLHVHVSGSFPAGCSCWCGPGPTDRQICTHTYTRIHTHTRPVLTYTSFQTATPPWRASVMCLHYVPCRILSSPVVQHSLFFSHLNMITRSRGSKDGSSQNRCFVLHRKHMFFVIATQTDLAVVQSLNRSLRISH